MASTTHDAEFVRHLQEEKLRTQETRTRYTIQKLTFVTGLMGLGSLGIQATQLVDSGYLLLLAPWVATAYDFYIMGEDYSVKRIGAFLQSRSVSEAERRWEDWVGRHRDPFAPVAMPLLTTLVFIGALLLSSGLGTGITDSTIYRLWVWITWIPSWASFLFYLALRRHVRKQAPLPPGSETPLAGVERAVYAADHVLTGRVFRAIAGCFTDVQRRPALLDEIRKSAREYGRQEFLQCVDRQGAAAPVSEDVLKDYRRIVASAPDLGLWFREATLSDGRPTLLVARWLCHAVGLRHRAVLLFLDHPTLADHLVLQVRGFDKAEAPGLFDLPAAGHVSGMESVEEALRKELGEELGLSTGAIEDLRVLGTYDYADAHNAEHRTVYRGRLRDADLLALGGDGEELAAVATFPVHKVAALLETQPERAASGLSASFALVAD